MGTSRSLLSKNISRGRGAGLAGLSSSSNHRTLFLPKYYQSYSGWRISFLLDVAGPAGEDVLIQFPQLSVAHSRIVIDLHRLVLGFHRSL